MINYEDLLFAMVTTTGKSIVVFLLLALILDYLYKMLFANAGR